MALGGITARFVAWEQVYDNGNSGVAKTIDWLNGNIQKMALTDDCELTFTNPLNGLHVLFVYQNNPDSNITWPASVQWAEGTDPGPDDDLTLMTSFYYDGTNYMGLFATFRLIDRGVNMKVIVDQEARIAIEQLCDVALKVGGLRNHVPVSILLNSMEQLEDVKEKVESGK